MRYCLATLALPLFGYTTRAIPVTLDATAVAASFPIRQLNETGVRADRTLPSSDVQALAARQEFPANLLLCQLVNCQGCTSFPLQGEIQDTCIAPGFQIISTAVAQPSNEGIPFLCDIGTVGCTSVAQIPEVNTCFNLNGGPFFAFAIVVPDPE